MELSSKFKKDLDTLRGAANGDFFLDVKNPKLFKKVRKHYEREGAITFSGDALDDYDILIVDNNSENVQKDILKKSIDSKHLLLVNISYIITPIDHAYI